MISAPKKCPFRYDLVWVKSAPAGFLSAKKMPMRKHEMIYVFYEKLPLYDLSSHKHKFIKSSNKGEVGKLYRDGVKRVDGKEGKYEPPLPVSVVKEHNNHIKDGQIYNGGKAMKVISDGKGHQYNPPLPVSVVKEEPEPEPEMRPSENYQNNSTMYGNIDRPDFKRKNGESMYQPPLPVSVVKEEKTQISKPQEKDLYGASNGGTIGNVHGTNYEPPLPVSVVKQEKMPKSMYGELPTTDSYAESVGIQKADKHKVHYNPPLPNSMLEIKSTRGKHSTEKPVALMEWVLKYYSKEGDTVLDPTMGSGSTGVACKNMNRNFIGMEMNDEIYEVACNRIYD